MDSELFDAASWIWGLALIALTIALHTTGVVLLAFAMLRMRRRLERPHLGHATGIAVVIVAIGSVAVLLATLHGIEALIWATAYLHVGAIQSPLDAMLYSIDSLTTRGASGLTLAPHWRLMGAIEAADGMLLFGISTAFLFAVMQAYWSMLARRN